jgi:hypothetical protein
MEYCAVKLQVALKEADWACDKERVRLKRLIEFETERERRGVVRLGDRVPVRVGDTLVVKVGVNSEDTGQASRSPTTYITVNNPDIVVRKSIISKLKTAFDGLASVSFAFPSKFTAHKFCRVSSGEVARAVPL